MEPYHHRSLEFIQLRMFSGLCVTWKLSWASSILGFLGSSAGKESVCNAGDPGSIPGLVRSAGEGIGYPLQYSWASLVAQLVKNLPAMRKTWVWSLGGEDPLEKGTATYSSILAGRILWTVQSMGSQRVGHDWATFTFSFCRLSQGKIDIFAASVIPIYEQYFIHLCI